MKQQQVDATGAKHFVTSCGQCHITLEQGVPSKRSGTNPRKPAGAGGRTTWPDRFRAPASVIPASSHLEPITPSASRARCSFLSKPTTHAGGDRLPMAKGHLLQVQLALEQHGQHISAAAGFFGAGCMTRPSDPGGGRAVARCAGAGR